MLHWALTKLLFKANGIKDFICAVDIAYFQAATAIESCMNTVQTCDCLTNTVPNNEYSMNNERV